MQLDRKRCRRQLRPFMLAVALAQLGVIQDGFAQGVAPLALTLPQAIDLALKQNRGLQLAQLAVVERQHQKEIARSAYFPQIKNESTMLHITELAGVDFPAGAFGSPAATGPIPAHNSGYRPGSAHDLHQRHRTGTAFDPDVQNP
jgi:outer membrane protein TolC